jgi:hypothetical protein
MTVTERIATHEAAMADLIAGKPSVVDAHSDGKRVRYVRHATAIETLRSMEWSERIVLALVSVIDGLAPTDLIDLYGDDLAAVMIAAQEQAIR